MGEKYDAFGERPLSVFNGKIRRFKLGLYIYSILLVERRALSLHGRAGEACPDALKSLDSA